MEQFGDDGADDHLAVGVDHELARPGVVVGVQCAAGDCGEIVLHRAYRSVPAACFLLGEPHGGNLRCREDHLRDGHVLSRRRAQAPQAGVVTSSARARATIAAAAVRA